MFKKTRCMRPVSFCLTNIFPSCDHAELMFGALYSSFRKFWFVWVRSSFITYWVPFSIFLFLQASSLCFLDINRTITGLFCLGRNGPKRWSMLISDSFISILAVLVRNLWTVLIDSSMFSSLLF